MANPDGGSELRIETFPLGPFQTNCHLVWLQGEEDAWIIDAGFDPVPMLDRVDELNLKPSRLLLTHAHVDHIAGVAETVRRFEQLTVWIHEAEKHWLADPVLNLSEKFGFPITLPEPEGTLAHNESLSLGKTTWRILHVPGHSPGSAVFACESAAVAIVGDTLFQDSIGRTDFPTSDHELLIESIRAHLFALPDETTCLPGHGPPTTIGDEKQNNPYVGAR